MLVAGFLDYSMGCCFLGYWSPAWDAGVLVDQHKVCLACWDQNLLSFGCWYDPSKTTTAYGYAFIKHFLGFHMFCNYTNSFKLIVTDLCTDLLKQETIHLLL